MKFDKAISLGGPFLIMMGATQQFIFYRFFHINILPFLELSEIITSFLDFVIFGVAFILLFIAHQARIPIFKQGWSEADITFRKYFNWFGSIAIFLFLAVFIIIPILKYGFLRYNVMTIMVVLIIAIAIRIGQRLTTGEAYGIYDTSLVVVAGLSFVMLISIKQYLAIKHGKKYLGTTITFENRPTIVCDSSQYYIGNTINYLFVFNEKQNRTSVFPLEDVKEISFKYTKKKFFSK